MESIRRRSDSARKEVKRNVPELRFEGFEGDWNSNKLGTLTSYVDYRGRAPIKSDDGHFLVTAKNIKNGYIDYEGSKEYVSLENYDTVMSKGLPRVGDVLFTTEAPMGNTAQVDRNDIALAQRVIKFRSRNLLTNEYLLYYFLSNPFRKHTLKKAIGSTVMGISGKELRKSPIGFPSLPEQTKIANFLTAVDSKIANLSEEKAVLENYKKGAMQKIFSQELRFKPDQSGAEGDDEGNDFKEWETKRLGEIATFLKGRGISKSDIVEGGANECIRYGELYTHYNEVIRDIKSKTNLPIEGLVFSKENDVIIPASGETQIDIATASCVTKKSIALSGDLNIIRTVQNGIFLAYYLKNEKRFEIAALAQGNSVVHLYSKQLRTIVLNLPSIPEQTKIANFLTSIDEKIEVVTSSLERTQTFKKGLLQKLFV